MIFLNLNEIKLEVNILARIINVPDDNLPTYGYSMDLSYPHIEVDKNGYHYVVVERGKELERKSTEDLHELLYWIFEDATFSMAIKYMLENRIEDKDPRRIFFKKQEYLLAKLNPNWCERKEKEHNEILKLHPFDDSAGMRVSYYSELRSKGFSEKEIEKMAYEKYPEE